MATILSHGDSSVTQKLETVSEWLIAFSCSKRHFPLDINQWHSSKESALGQPALDVKENVHSNAKPDEHKKVYHQA